LPELLPEEKAPGSGPVGSGDHTVKDGECVSFLAAKNNLQHDDIWNHPANANLHQVRVNPNVLFPGDRIAIRSIQTKEQDGPVDQQSVFEFSSETVFLRMKVLDRNKPLGSKPFILSVEGSPTIQGKTQADGTVEAEIPATATSGFLIVGEGVELFQMELNLGTLHPVATETGVQQRLQNLGFDCGKIDGVVGPRTRGAIRNFQGSVGLNIDGKLTPETRNKLKEEHGC
jgi:hypothetical protein